MDSHLNCFAPYERAVELPENQLTRTLLVVLFTSAPLISAFGRCGSAAYYGVTLWNSF